MPDASGSIDLSNLSAEEKAAVEDLAEQTPGEPEPEGSGAREVLTAFLVVVDLNGNPDISAFPHPSLNARTEPTADLIYGAASTILKDLAAQETALATAEVMQQHAMALQQQMQDQMLQRQVAAGLKTGPR